MSLINEMTLEERARVYSLLGDVFGDAPTEESTNAVSGLAEALGIPGPAGLTLAEIEREFLDLFVVPNKRYVAPYESAYRDRWEIPGPNAEPTLVGGLLMGDSTAAVWQAFVDAGVKPARDLPDHIANELRLVGHLWHVEAYASAPDAAKAARQRERLVAEHLLQWIGDVGEKVARNGASGFYRVAIEAAHALLRAECGPLQSDGVPETATLATPTESHQGAASAIR